MLDGDQLEPELLDPIDQSVEMCLVDDVAGQDCVAAEVVIVIPANR